MLPHKRSKDSEAEFEEERRLLFVGITRAKQWLQLSCCKRRAIRGDVRPVIASPFLNELPLEEMKRIESTRKQDWFDDDYDQSYPDSWDLPDEESGEVRESAAADFASDELCQLPEHERAETAVKNEPVGVTTGLKTAADLLASRATPLNAYREGIQVRHAEHGEGVILSVTGRGPKRIARVRFSDGEHSFRLAFADLEVV
jgi:DNA helicase-2/ATP-dependent DNA helicase PcrA